MLQQPLLREFESGLRGFADGGVLQGAFAGGDGVPDAEEGGDEAALAEAGVRVGGGEEEVGVAEVEGGLVVLLC